MVEWGEELRRVYPVQAYTTLFMLVGSLTRAPYTLLCISHVLASAALQAMSKCPGTTRLVLGCVEVEVGVETFL